MALDLCGLSLQNPQSGSYHEKSIRVISTGRGPFTKYFTSTPQNCQGHPNKGSLRKCHSQEKPKETWQLNVIRCWGWGPGTNERHQIKKKKSLRNLNKMQTLVNDNVLILAH